MDVFTRPLWFIWFDIVWMVLSCLTMLRHLVSCRSHINVQGLANLFIYYELQNIFSVCRAQFPNEFRNRVTDGLKINTRLSIEFHPETDGKTKRFNTMISQTLCAFLNYPCNNCERWLIVTKFTRNNMYSKTTHTSQFFVKYSFHSPFHENLSPGWNLEDTQTRMFIVTMKQMEMIVKTEIVRAQDRQEEAVNWHQIILSSFQPEDKV